jgi:hypothetical protein
VCGEVVGWSLEAEGSKIEKSLSLFPLIDLEIFSLCTQGGTIFFQLINKDLEIFLISGKHFFSFGFGPKGQY